MRFRFAKPQFPVTLAVTLAVTGLSVTCASVVAVGTASAQGRAPVTPVTEHLSARVGVALSAPISAQSSDPSGLGASLDCPADPVATAIDGGAMSAETAMLEVLAIHAMQSTEPANVVQQRVRELVARVDAQESRDSRSHEREPLSLGASCRDGTDPQCSPLSPAPGAPGFSPGSPAPHWLPAAFDLPSFIRVRDLPASLHAEPLFDRDGRADGVTQQLDRPPRLA